MADKLQLQTNIPVEVALAFDPGNEKRYPSRFEGKPDQVMFTFTDGRIAFLDEPIAAKIYALNLKKGEPFDIVRKEVSANGRKWIETQVSKVGTVPDEPAPAAAPPSRQVSATTGNTNGTVQSTAASNGSTAPKPNGNGHNGANGNGHTPAASPYEHTGWSLFLAEQTNMLVDVYARCLAYASQQYGNQVKPEDVRALMTTAYINISKGGAR